MSGAALPGAGATITAAAPSPKIIREVRTVPILSENFSAQTTRIGSLISCSRRTASLRPYDMPAHAATMSQEVWVCDSPSSPDNHVATDGIRRVLVQLQKRTAPISAGLRLALASALRAA